jgi:ferredoxin/ferritin
VSHSINVKACIRCAACATVAPRHFSVGVGPAKLIRAAETEAEHRACDSAAALCPTQAIAAPHEALADRSPREQSRGDASEPGPAPREVRDALHPSTALGTNGSELFPGLLTTAEGVRWQISDLPWTSFDPSKAMPELRTIVREMAYSEQATFSATQRFMQAFGEDLDFSQWISVWFYEETRHPMVLLKWLERAGETPGAQFVTAGRVSQPFMKSRTGTLVTNVISEMFAAEAYLGVALTCPEPLLAAIAQRITADEARHGGSFFAYARRAIATSDQPDRERLDALKVLHFWLNENQQVSHPVNETMEKMKTLRGAGGGVIPAFRPPNERIVRVVGRLTGLPIQSPADVPAQLIALTKQVHAAAAE